MNSGTKSEHFLEFRSLCRAFEDGFVAVDNFNLTIKQGEFVTFLGPSGCGKTTTLRMLAGFDMPSSGEILLNGRDITKLPPNERPINTVFQRYALFPHLNIFDNIAFGLKLKKLPRTEVVKKVKKALEMVDLEGFAKAYPKELSGGMKQRVAIARAYAVNPKVLLMDEPFGALDAQTRTQLQQELLNTWEKEQKTCFFITHDVEEAIILAQRVVIMCARPGRVKEIVDIDIPYPRDQETKMSPRFLELKNHIWSQVYQEYLSVRK